MITPQNKQKGSYGKQSHSHTRNWNNPMQKNPRRNITERSGYTHQSNIHHSKRDVTQGQKGSSKYAVDDVRHPSNKKNVRATIIDKFKGGPVGFSNEKRGNPWGGGNFTVKY